MKVDRDVAMKSLSKKGFSKKPDGDHIYFHHEYKGKVTGAWTKFSHSKKEKDINDYLISCMQKQLKLDKRSEVINLLKCPMDRDSYNDILIRKISFLHDPKKMFESYLIGSWLDLPPKQLHRKSNRCD